MTRTIQQMIASEVHYCVSSLVSTLANGGMLGGSVDLANLSDQAQELASPLPDYESAAREAGWSAKDGLFWIDGDSTQSGSSPEDICGWENLCAEHDIEPHEREVFEHWIVSDWLADMLEAAGEEVDKDFAGMTIWARTTTGQAIYADHVIETIYAETHRDAA